ncbi:MAG: tRNA (adenosine(37)-N6)-threonylcarbamoyltransferase complex dimerization subunit type 1 TsaB [Tannerellaceae bacterium]|jgi:tRNA threonylcarbamoyladenosine biosynthesis protein TsaB|nr:tRNA (adenosine(37)-N6)-threonylcarbamoyltransferase complex dimerization subunit type 1 TsaB [Tannerellaceae bacterium]
MSSILTIETSTSVCSAALSVDGKIDFEKVSFEGPSHAALLGVFIEEAVTHAKKKGIPLDAVAVSSGPGSYTGLRIGVSMAKGLCFGYNIPLLAIPTLDIMACKVIKENKLPDDTLYCAMLDARRMEVYAAIYDNKLHIIRSTLAEVVTADTYSPFLETNQVCFFGNGAAKCKSIITSPHAIFIDHIVPLAGDMATLANERFVNNKFEDTAYFEPFYLKEFVATVAKNKVLGNR